MIKKEKKKKKNIQEKGKEMQRNTTLKQNWSVNIKRK